jgi:hypothetical protein
MPLYGELVAYQEMLVIKTKLAPSCSLVLLPFHLPPWHDAARSPSPDAEHLTLDFFVSRQNKFNFFTNYPVCGFL